MSSLTFLEAPSFKYFFQSRIVEQSPKGSLFNLVSYMPEQRKIDPTKPKEERISFKHESLLDIFASPISKFMQVKQGTEIAICSSTSFLQSCSVQIIMHIRKSVLFLFDKNLILCYNSSLK